MPFLARILLTLNVFRADMTQLCKISLRYLLYIYSSNTEPDNVILLVGTKKENVISELRLELYYI